MDSFQLQPWISDGSRSRATRNRAEQEARGGPVVGRPRQDALHLGGSDGDVADGPADSSHRTAGPMKFRPEFRPKFRLKFSKNFGDFSQNLFKFERDCLTGRNEISSENFGHFGPGRKFLQNEIDACRLPEVEPLSLWPRWDSERSRSRSRGVRERLRKRRELQLSSLWLRRPRRSRSSSSSSLLRPSYRSTGRGSWRLLGVLSPSMMP